MSPLLLPSSFKSVRLCHTCHLCLHLYSHAATILIQAFHHVLLGLWQWLRNWSLSLWSLSLPIHSLMSLIDHSSKLTGCTLFLLKSLWFLPTMIYFSEICLQSSPNGIPDYFTLLNLIFCCSPTQSSALQQNWSLYYFPNTWWVHMPTAATC